MACRQYGIFRTEAFGRFHPLVDIQFRRVEIGRRSHTVAVLGSGEGVGRKMKKCADFVVHEIDLLRRRGSQFDFGFAVVRPEQPARAKNASNGRNLFVIGLSKRFEFG
ncbi:MAG: hypothetical protein ACLR8Y_04920 [Alistipes indistinctus]